MNVVKSVSIKQKKFDEAFYKWICIYYNGIKSLPYVVLSFCVCLMFVLLTNNYKK